MYYRYYLKVKKCLERNFSDRAYIHFSELPPDQFIFEECKTENRGRNDEEYFDYMVLVHEITKDDFYNNRYYSRPIREYTFLTADDEKTEVHRNAH